MTGSEDDWGWTPIINRSLARVDARRGGRGMMPFDAWIAEIRAGVTLEIEQSVDRFLDDLTNASPTDTPESDT